MIKAVFFDFDGVLVDSMPAHVRAWKQTLAEIGIEIDDIYFQLHEGEKPEDTIRELLRERNVQIPDEEQRKLIERKRALYRAEAPNGLVPAARELVDELRTRNIQCNIVTGSIRRNMEATLSAAEISLFAHVITAENYDRGKPRPDPYLTGLSASGMIADASLVLENAPLGIQSARAAGVKTIAIATTLPAEYLSEANHIIHRYSELLQYV